MMESKGSRLIAVCLGVVAVVFLGAVRVSPPVVHVDGERADLPARSSAGIDPWPPPYRLTDLGVLADAAESHAFNLNELGQVVGLSGESVSFGHAFLFTDSNDNGQADPGEMIDLGTIGGPYSVAYGINNLGHVVGMATNDIETNPNGWPRYEGRPFLYVDGVMHDLGTIPGYEYLALAYEINNSGHIAGRLGDAYTTGYAFELNPDTGEKTMLPTFPGTAQLGRSAYGINKLGLVTGSVRYPAGGYDVVATVWQQTDGIWEVIELGTIAVHDLLSPHSAGMDINDLGQVVGWSSAYESSDPAPYPNHGFLVSPQGDVWFVDDDGDGLNDLMVDLGTLGGVHSTATGINNFGQVVGGSQLIPSDYHYHAFVWADGVMFDLNDHIDPDSGWVLERARAINDTGQIVGSALNPAGESRAFLLTPDPDDCNFNGIPDEQDIADGTSGDCNANGTPDECELDCNNNGFADDCDISQGTSTDCDANGVPDDCEPDCNGNGIADGCDIADGTSQDCTANGIPDECESDCNANGSADSCDLADGSSPDCNGNAIPDSCDIVDGASLDCNGNGVPDACEVPPQGDGADCNENGVPDECDISSGTSDDCNANGIPDDCEYVDCNSNGVLDACDLASGTSPDTDRNGVPDECDGRGLSLKATGADGPHSIVGNTIYLQEAGQRITFDIRISGWDLDLNGMPRLRTYQAQLDSSGYATGETGSLSLPWINIPCLVDADCPGWNPTCPASGICEENGAFFIDETRQDYVFYGLDTISVADISQPDVRLAATLWEADDAVADSQAEFYAGTVVLDVSADATGIFTIGFLEGEQFCLMADANSENITIPSLNAATIVLPPDCNGNLIPDNVDLANGTSEDCNENGIPDECDIADASSVDCNENGMPDECEDCNENGLADECDIADGTSPDGDGNGIPDECEIIPMATLIGGRFFAVTPHPDTGPCTISVGCPAGTSYYVSDPDQDTLLAHLVTDPAEAAFLTPAEWGGTVSVFDTIIRHETTYEIRTDYGDGFVSMPHRMTTLKWGDAVGSFDRNAWTPPNGVVDMLDISSRVDAFRHLTTAPQMRWVDMWPVEPDLQIDFVDIAYGVDAFRGMQDPYGEPCP